MTAIKGIVKARRVELDAPSDWPDGTEVEIHPINQAGDAETISAEEIARTLAAMDQIQPLEMTDAERLAWDAECRENRERDKCAFHTNAERLRRIWE